MKKLLPFALLGLVPALAFALDYTDVSDQYTDAPFSLSEAAGISVLTEVGAVEGNPDGSFAANRTLNRAEFLKIALRASGYTATEKGGCFPDTPIGAWFSSYVCTAKKSGAVQGNPDGMFHPERAVNYAEAVKMLVELFDYTLPEPPSNERWAWYRAYILAAEEHNVELPGNVEAGTELTRGQMARLAAAFVAESEGELDEYRAFEKGQTISSASSSSLNSSNSSASSVVSSSSNSSNSSISSVSSSSRESTIFPAVSSFIVPGATSDVLIDGLFVRDEDSRIYIVELELFRQILSLESLVLIDENGTEIATLKLRSYDNTAKTKWRAEIVPAEGYLLTKDKPMRLGIRAKTKPAGNGAASNELFELRSWSITTNGQTSGAGQQLIATDQHAPLHQTSFGHITSVSEELGTSLTVQEGNNRMLGSFKVTGTTATGTSLSVLSLNFLLQSSNVNLTNIRIGGPNPVQQGGCSRETINNEVMLTCLVPESMQSITSQPVTLNVYSDVTLLPTKQTGSVHLAADGTGGIGSAGTVRWTDQSGTFNWIESDVLLESGPTVTITK